MGYVLSGCSCIQPYEEFNHAELYDPRKSLLDITSLSS